MNHGSRFVLAHFFFRARMSDFETSISSPRLRRRSDSMEAEGLGAPLSLKECAQRKSLYAQTRRTEELIICGKNVIVMLMRTDSWVPCDRVLTIAEAECGEVLESMKWRSVPNFVVSWPPRARIARCQQSKDFYPICNDDPLDTFCEI
jgi:hypothetical protein